MPHSTPIQSADSTWKALSDSSRRTILDLLHEQPCTTSDVVAACEGLSRFKVMGHLAVLREAGLVVTEKQGRERINHLNTAPLGEAYDDWMRKYEVEWAGRLGRLKRHVEQKQRTEQMNVIAPTSPLTTIEFEQDIEIGAPPSAVFVGLTDDIGEWFGPPYVQTGEDAMDVVLDAKPGGLWVETTKAGGGAVWGVVQEVRRDQVLAIEGRMGMRPAIFSRTVFTLTPKTGGCVLNLSFRAVGSFTEEHEHMFTEGLKDMFGNRLKTYAEGGPPIGIRAQ